MPPVDVFSEAKGLQRRRALLEQLAKGGAQPQIQGPAGPAIAQLLAALGQSYFANEGLRGVEQAEGANQERYQAGLGSELEKFLQTSQGAPGMYELPPDQAGPQVPALPADPKAAVLSAMISKYPEMQGIGKGMLPSLLQKPEKSPKLDEWKIAPDGRPYRTGASGDLEVGSGLFPKKDTPAVEINNYPKATEKLIEAEGKSLQPGGEEYERARAGKSNLSATSEALSALANGAKTGQFADFFQAVRKTGKALGIDGIETAANDQLGAVLAQRVLASSATKALAGPMSDKDREFLQAAAGTTSTDPEALRRILAIGAALSFNDVTRFNSGIKSLAGEQGMGFLQRHASPISWNPPDDPLFRQMFERALMGQPTVDAPGGALTAPRPTAPPRRPILTPVPR